MAQEKIRINNTDIYQPDSGLAYDFETTYTEDSARVQTGTGHFTPMFTVERLGFGYTHIPQKDATKILRLVAKGGNVTLHYFSLFYGEWRNDTFYVGQGSLSIGSLEDGDEYLDSLSFNMVGVNPI